MQSGSREYQRALDLLGRGNYAEGQALLLALLRRDPNDPRLLDALARASTETGAFDRALYFAQQRLALQPEDAGAALSLIHVLTSAGKPGEAVAKAREFLLRFSADPGFVVFAAAAFQNSGLREEAEAALRGFEDRARTDPAVLSALGAVLLGQGRAPEAEAVLRRSLALFPGHLNTLATLANTLNYIEGADRTESFRIIRESARLLESNFPVIDPLSYENDPDPDRVIRVGLATSDLRRHAVARFVEPILKHHDADRVRIFVYYTYPLEDDSTARLKPMADEWRSIRTTRAGAVAREIYSDRIDVLFELGGLSGNSNIASLVPQVAPVQVSAIGYPNTTGISTVGYRFVDSITDPPGEADRFATEKLVRLDPCFLCFQPEHAPMPRREIAERHPVFGSFNNIMKYTDSALALWSRILQRVPGARLLFKTGGLSSSPAQARFLARLEKAGISPDRVELHGTQERSEAHLAMYNRIDVALDTFPYNGTTTTCEALLMGVPVVSLEGSTHAGRVGASLLRAAGFADNVAQTPERYIERAVAVASDSGTSESARSALRQAFLNSVLCDGPAYTNRWQSAVRSIWQDWCVRRTAQNRPDRR